MAIGYSPYIISCKYWVLLWRCGAHDDSETFPSSWLLVYYIVHKKRDDATPCRSATFIAILYWGWPTEAIQSLWCTGSTFFGRIWSVLYILYSFLPFVVRNRRITIFFIDSTYNFVVPRFCSFKNDFDSPITAHLTKNLFVKSNGDQIWRASQLGLYGIVAVETWLSFRRATGVFSDISQVWKLPDELSGLPPDRSTQAKKKSVVRENKNWKENTDLLHKWIAQRPLIRLFQAKVKNPKATIR